MSLIKSVSSHGFLGQMDLSEHVLLFRKFYSVFLIYIEVNLVFNAIMKAAFYVYSWLKNS
jgi:hypothetical protein